MNELTIQDIGDYFLIPHTSEEGKWMAARFINFGEDDSGQKWYGFALPNDGRYSTTSLEDIRREGLCDEHFKVTKTTVTVCCARCSESSSYER